MAFDVTRVPLYKDLPIRADLPRGFAWGVFGEDDQVGCLNFLTPERTRAATACIRTGKVFPLNWDLNLPKRGPTGRKNLKHRLGYIRETFTDDVLHDFYPQASSQWDALRHARDTTFSGLFYNGTTVEDATVTDGGKLGIENFARRGLAGRGVLIDVARQMAKRGEPIDGFKPFPVTVPMLKEMALAEGVEFRAGDTLVVRTGWLEKYESLTAEEREEFAQPGRGSGSPGLAGGYEMAEFLWDNQFVGAAADNNGLQSAGGDGTPGMSLHTLALAGFGMNIGELWYLEELAADCAADGQYDFMITSAPLNLPGGSGSTANALAIK